MRGRFLLFCAVITLSLMYTSAFLTEVGNRRSVLSGGINMKSNNNSYRRMLKKAKDGRPKKQNASVQSQPDIESPVSQKSAPSPVQVQSQGQQIAWDQQVDTESMSTREKAKFKNQVPFTEDMYETIKACVNILSDRSNKENPKRATQEEAMWFKDAIEAIIEDAHLYGPPKRPERAISPPDVE